MPIFVLNNKATNQVKNGGGMLRNMIIVNAGTSWTIQIKDGPDSAGNTQTLLGAAAVTVPAVGTQLINPIAPIPFRDGLQIVTAGTTAGEIEVQFD